jgi:hypothetical protein
MFVEIGSYYCSVQHIEVIEANTLWQHLETGDVPEELVIPALIEVKQPLDSTS